MLYSRRFWAVEWGADTCGRSAEIRPGAAWFAALLPSAIFSQVAPAPSPPDGPRQPDAIHRRTISQIVERGKFSPLRKRRDESRRGTYQARAIGRVLASGLELAGRSPPPIRLASGDCGGASDSKTGNLLRRPKELFGHIHPCLRLLFVRDRRLKRSEFQVTNLPLNVLSAS